MKRLEKLSMFIEHARKEDRTINDRVKLHYLKEFLNSEYGKSILKKVAQVKNLGGNLQGLSNISVEVEIKNLGIRHFVNAEELLEKVNITLEDLEKCMYLQFKDSYLNEYIFQNKKIPTKVLFQEYLKKEGVNKKEHFAEFYKNGFSKKKLLENHVVYNENHFMVPQFKSESSKYLGDFNVKNYHDRKSALHLGYRILQKWIYIPLTMEILKKELASDITSFEFQIFNYFYSKEKIKNYHIDGYINDFRVKETFPEQFITAILVQLYDQKKELITYEPSYDWLGRYLPDFELKNTFLEVVNWKNGKGYKKRLEKKRSLVLANSTKNYETIELDFKKYTLKEVFEKIKSVLFKNNEPIIDLEFEECDFVGTICSGETLQRQEELKKLYKELKII